MNIRFVIFGFILYLSSFLAGYCYAQNTPTNFTSEKDIAKQAELFFTQENYIGAKPLFSQLLSLHPNDVNYTFKFGVCEIYYLSPSMASESARFLDPNLLLP